MVNLAGGDCVEDLRKVEKDEGFCRILRRVGQQGMKRRERREHGSSLAQGAKAERSLGEFSISVFIGIS